MANPISHFVDTQNAIWNDPEQRIELIKFTAVCALASYVALELFKQINFAGKELMAAGFVILPFLSPEKREVSIVMSAALVVYNHHIKDSNYTPGLIVGVVAIGAYIYGSMFSKKKAD